MYKLVATISFIIRQFYIPNPFEALGDGVTIFIGDSPILLSPDVLNWGAGLLLPAITFGVVGLYYESGSAPALGSFLYLLLYCIHTGIIWLMAIAGFATWAIVLIVAAYIGVHVGFGALLSCKSG